MYLTKNLAWTGRSALKCEVYSRFGRRRQRSSGSSFMAALIGCMTMNHDSWVAAVASWNVRYSRSKDNLWTCLQLYDECQFLNVIITLLKNQLLTQVMACIRRLTRMIMSRKNRGWYSSSLLVACVPSFRLPQFMVYCYQIIPKARDLSNPRLSTINTKSFTSRYSQML